MNRTRAMLLACTACLAGLAEAQPNMSAHPVVDPVPVVATTTSAAMLVHEIGGSKVALTTLLPPHRETGVAPLDAEDRQALRQARLVVAMGAGREEAWLPQALAASGNRHLQPEGDGYFAIAAQVPLLDRHGNALARAITTVPANSNVQLDPALMARAGHALADRLAALYPEYAANFRDHARDFAQLVAMHRERWAPRLAGVPGALLYTHDADYLMVGFDIPVLGYIVTEPGRPPAPEHLDRLVLQLAERRGVILYTIDETPDTAAIGRVASALHWPLFALPAQPVTGAGAADYFAMLDRWLEAVTSPQ